MLAPPPTTGCALGSAAANLLCQLRAPALRLAQRLPRLALRATLAFAVGSVLLIGGGGPALGGPARLRLHAAPRLGWWPGSAARPPLLPALGPLGADTRQASGSPPSPPRTNASGPPRLRPGGDPQGAGPARRALRGASTITQQTAKNLFLWPERSWLRKGLEAWLTAWIELLWPKERILEVYLNIVQLSPSTYGVGAASERYFDRPVSELDLEEASLLAGVLPAPGAYRLDRPSGRLRRRAEWIADQTRRLGGARYLERL